MFSEAGNAIKKLPHEWNIQAGRPHEVSSPFSVMAVTSLTAASELQIVGGVKRRTESTRIT